MKSIHRFALPFLAVATAILVRTLLDLELANSIPYGFFFLAVAVCTLLAGFWPSVISALLGVVAVRYFFLEPRFMLFGKQPDDDAACFLFFLISLAISVLGFVAERSKRQLLQSREELRRANDILSKRTEKRGHQLVESRRAFLSESRYLEAAFDHALTPLVFLDPAFNFIRVNKKYAEADGKLPSDFLGHNHFELYPNEENEQIFREVIRTKTPFVATAKPFEYPEPGRGLTYWDWALIPVMNNQGEIEFLVFSLENVTERKRAELEVERHRSNLKELVEQRTAELDGASRKLQQSVERFKLLSDTSSQLLASREPLVLADSLCKRVMEHLDCDLFFNFIADPIAGELHLNAFAGIPDEESRKIEWLEYGSAICGCAARDGCRIVAENIAETCDRRADLVRSYGVRAYACHPLLGVEGSVVGTLYFGTRSHDTFSEDDLFLMKAVADQVSVAMQRIRTEDELAATARQREQLLESERIARMDAERANNLKNEFVANVSHELRTPLNAILGWTQLLKRGSVAPAKAIPIIEKSAKSQAQLIEDLLDLNRILSGKLQFESGAVDFPEVITTAIGTVAPAAQEKNIHLKLSMAEEKTRTMGDAARLQQVVINLLTNAIKFTPSGGLVSVELRNNGSTAEISVTDTGIGIDADMLPLIFERFRQADSSSTRKHGGLGLGLAIARHIVDMHGGTIEAESPGKGLGATFRVRLPLAEVMLEAMPASEEDPGEVDLSNLSILVIDDEPLSLDLIRRILEERGAQVSCASSGGEALALMETERPSLVISDIGMPGMDGHSLIRTIRALSDERSTVPAIALTAFARMEDRMRALDAGFSSHMSKPLDTSALLRAIGFILKDKERPELCLAG